MSDHSRGTWRTEMRLTRYYVCGLAMLLAVALLGGCAQKMMSSHEYAGMDESAAAPSVAVPLRAKSTVAPPGTG